MAAVGELRNGNGQAAPMVARNPVRKNRQKLHTRVHRPASLFETGTSQSRQRYGLSVAWRDRAGHAARWSDSVVSSSVILVVEDEWLLRQAMVDELSAAGWSVLEATSGKSALELLESDGPIDLLITDIRLGDAITGWDVADAFRRNNARVPVIYVSANSACEHRRVKNSVFLNKPCRFDRLLEACQSLCSP
jgi:two-component system cell cycle response regulator CpdR